MTNPETLARFGLAGLGKCLVWGNLPKPAPVFYRGSSWWENRAENNVLKLVEALLVFADGKITVPPDKLKAQFKVEWVSETQLRVSGTVTTKPNGRPKTVEKGIKNVAKCNFLLTAAIG